MLVRVDWSATESQRAAIRQYRAAAAFHRRMAAELTAACTHDRACAGGPCVEAAVFLRNARRLEAQAWLEEHDS